jgi:hypothetical protein
VIPTSDQIVKKKSSNHGAKVPTILILGQTAQNILTLGHILKFLLTLSQYAPKNSNPRSIYIYKISFVLGETILAYNSH